MGRGGGNTPWRCHYLTALSASWSEDGPQTVDMPSGRLVAAVGSLLKTRLLKGTLTSHST